MPVNIGPAQNVGQLLDLSYQGSRRRAYRDSVERAQDRQWRSGEAATDRAFASQQQAQRFAYGEQQRQAALEASRQDAETRNRYNLDYLRQSNEWTAARQEALYEREQENIAASLAMQHAEWTSERDSRMQADGWEPTYNTQQQARLSTIQQGIDSIRQNDALRPSEKKRMLEAGYAELRSVQPGYKRRDTAKEDFLGSLVDMGNGVKVDPRTGKEYMPPGKMPEIEAAKVKVQAEKDARESFAKTRADYFKAKELVAGGAMTEDEVKQWFPELQQAQTPQPKSKQEFDALPSGTQFMAPDGTLRVKP